MSLERKLEITVLKAMWEECFDKRMDAAEILHGKTAPAVERIKAQKDLIFYGIEMAKAEIAIRRLEKTP